MTFDDIHKIDLHMHTRISDGSDTLEELLVHLREAGVQLFSVTDHDGIRGSMEMPLLLEAGAPWFIRGVEFSCKDTEGKYHILGYGYDPEHPAIQNLVEKGHGFRIDKTRARLDYLKEEFGFTFPQDEIDELFAQSNPGKPHIAKMMIRQGYAKTIPEAIVGYLDGKQFVGRHVAPDETIAAILESGGIPVLAHPAYGSGDEVVLGRDLTERLERLMEFGLAGVEAYYSGFTDLIQRQILRLADEYDLYVTAGSDYHGPVRMADLGDTNLEDAAEGPEGLKRFLNDVKIIRPQAEED